MPKDREERISFWFCWCFSTNIAYALDLYLVLLNRTHFKQSVERRRSLNSEEGMKKVAPPLEVPLMEAP
jgi:hypothetical protein